MASLVLASAHFCLIALFRPTQDLLCLLMGGVTKELRELQPELLPKLLPFLPPGLELGLPF